jgi:hypothetical protein
MFMNKSWYSERMVKRMVMLALMLERLLERVTVSCRMPYSSLAEGVIHWALSTATPVIQSHLPETAVFGTWVRLGAV